MFLNILEFKEENFSKNVVSEINQKNLFCPQNPPKIVICLFVCFAQKPLAGGGGGGGGGGDGEGGGK